MAEAQTAALSARAPALRKSLLKTPAGAVAFQNVQVFDADAQQVPRRSHRGDRQGTDHRRRPVEVGEGPDRRASHRRAWQDAAARPVGLPHAHWQRLHRIAGTVDGRHLVARPGQRRQPDPRSPRARCQGRAAPAQRLSLFAHRRQGAVCRADRQCRQQPGGDDRVDRQGQGGWFLRREVLRHAGQGVGAGRRRARAQARTARARPHPPRHAPARGHQRRLRRDHAHQLDRDAGHARRRHRRVQRHPAIRGPGPLRQGPRSRMATP